MFILFVFCSALQRWPKGPLFQDTAELEFRLARRGHARARFRVVNKEADMATGTVKFFNHSRGFGFIAPSDGGQDVFVHATAVESSEFSEIREGQKLSYEVETDRRSGKSAAVKLQEA